MICRDILKELYGRHVRIGFKNGTSFMYCNKVTDNTEAEIKAEQNKFVEKVRTSYENAKAYLENFISWGYSPSSNKRLRKGEDEREALLKQKKNFVEKAHNKLIFVTKTRPDFILDSEVVEYYMSEDPEEIGTVIILLEGDFNGDYWNEAEYLKTGYCKLNDLDNEGCIRLACSVLSSAVKSRDKSFFYSEYFGVYMPNYNGADIWKQLKEKGMVHERKGLYCSKL